MWKTCSAAAIAAGLMLLSAPAQGASAYPSMAPLSQYLDADRNHEIAQARAAAPPALAKDAEVLVLTPKGYVTAVKGTNGFVCLVQRAWFSPLEDTEFWNPKGRAPMCIDREGARSILPAFMTRTGWVLTGATREQITARTRAAMAAGQIKVPTSGIMSYMLAKDAYHSDRVHGPWHPHVMIFTPPKAPAEWGANLPGSPVQGSRAGDNPWTIFFIPVAAWSDGTPDAHPMESM